MATEIAILLRGKRKWANSAFLFPRSKIAISVAILPKVFPSASISHHFFSIVSFFGVNVLIPYYLKIENPAQR
jgi:hypothetical protein